VGVNSTQANRARAARRVRGVLGGLVAGCLAAAASGAGGAAPARGAAPAPLAVTVDAIAPGGVIPRAFASCVPATPGHTAPGPNRSPAVRWSKGPAGTASYAVIMYDTDVPVSFQLADKEGQTIPAGFKRRPRFYHWVLVDIPATVQQLPQGAESQGPEPKPTGPAPSGGLRGANEVSGQGGYDGPCPPWNDAIPHHYHYTVYALNVARLPLSGAFGGADAVRAMRGHVLAQGELVGVYTQNPAVAKTLGAK
jgi:Raf kinase inhibitor-like YbhB/YbcL family protein